MSTYFISTYEVELAINTGEFSLTKDLLVSDDIPPYAILSHTWGADTEEVSFKDMIDGTSKRKTGYDKILNEKLLRTGSSDLQIGSIFIQLLFLVGYLGRIFCSPMQFIYFIYFIRWWSVVNKGLYHSSQYDNLL